MRKYKLETELLYGNLSLYEIDKWKTWNDSYLGEEGQKEKKYNLK